MKKQSVKECRTLIKIGIPTGEYIAGEGGSTVFKLVSAKVGTSACGEEVTTDCFYCEWLGAYGTQATQAQQDGIVRPARVRMPFAQCVYDALNTKGCKIFLRGRQDTEHTFELASGADDYLQQNAMLEFQVKHYEGK